MSRFGFSSPIFRWKLDFGLAPRLQFVSGQDGFAKPPFLLDFWLVLAGFLVVQSLHSRLQENGFVLAVRLKFQIAWYIS
jgi:hypothetical protein